MSGPPKTGPVDEVRQHIISSLFSRKAEDGTPEETLISYVKVYEDESGADVVQPGSSSAKTRYLMLAADTKIVTKHGKVVMHKAKRNNNLSFSKGKTWSLEDMRVLEVIGPTDFALTMTIRRYHWATDKAKDQMHFLNSVVKVYRTYTKGEVPELINFNPPPPSATGPPPNGSGERQPSFSSQSPLPRNMDLAPPQMLRQHRSGSSTSITSAQSSAYGGVASESSFSRTRSRPSLDEPRAGSSLGKSPLSDSNMPPRRPMINQVQSSRSPPSSSHGLGMGMPSNGRRQSEERLGDPIRKASAASEYGEGSSIPKAVRRPSNDMRAIAETEDRPSSRSNSRGNLAADAMDRPGSSRSNGDREREKPKPSPLPPAPTGQLAPVITTTLPSPSIPQSSQGLSPVDQDRRPQRRKSFHPAPVNTAFSREVLLTSRTNILPGAAGLTLEGDKMATEDALLANVEEMLEGFDWTAGVGTGESKKAGADAIESRLLDELAALDSANIHAFLESDDRIAQVLGHIDEALLEMDEIDAQITGYRMQLNAVSDDISYIESQNRGLQVQTSNQQALLTEIRQLLQIVEVPSEDLRIITHESPGTQKGVQNLEKAVASLYKALQAGQDQANAEVSATIARMKEYEENSAQFCKRVFDYLDVTFKYQSDQTLSESRKSGKKNIQLNPHTGMCEFLMMYEGLVLYLKEMDELRYQKLCSNYMSTISSLHQNEMKDMLMNLMGTLNASNTGEPNEASFSTAAGSMIPKTSALQKSKAVVGLKATDSTIRKEKKGDDNAHRVSELYQTALTQIVNQVLTEESFINAFLHLTDTESTFADHMELDSYFRRQAARHAAKQMSPGLMQLIRSMMDLVFGFVDVELKNWSEAATERNAIAVVGLLGVTERLAKEAEEEDTSIFFAQLFDRQLARQRAAVEAFAVDQIKVIDNGRNTVKRRRAVAFFVKHFPVFVEKMEAQLVDCDGLPVRSRVNDIYERIVNAIFGTVQQIAKLDRAESQTAEDKGQLNYNVVVIENMHHFVEDVSQLNLSSLGVFVERARGLYRENMTVYVKMLLRRSFGRMMDFFDGVEKLLSTTPASEVHLHNAYSRSNLKKILKDYGAKDMRKAIETMTRRVDKHFGGDDADPSLAPSSEKGALISIVWKEVTAGLKNETARAADIIKRSYGDSGLSLEYGPADVEASCKRAKQ